MLAIAGGWHRGPTTTPIDDPTQMGPVVEAMLAPARTTAGMDGTDLDG